jgi:hypothetical protein
MEHWKFCRDRHFIHATCQIGVAKAYLGEIESLLYVSLVNSYNLLIEVILFVV